MLRARNALVFLPAAISLVLMVVRLGRDVHGKPLIEDEAIAGLIGARPLGESLATVLGDRGGAPLHFLLVHAVLVLDSSAAALRWLSVALAVGAALAGFELGRRLAGPVAAAAGAIVVATSGLLTIYGSIARMYALFALVGGLAALLFVRALDLRTPEAALAAALAAWLLPATHPYGGIAVAGEALVALAVWRGRPLRPALPVIAVAAAALPFAFVDFRLADRFDVGAGGRALADPGESWRQLELAVRGSAGGGGVGLVVCLMLAAVGLATLARDRPPVAALAGLWLLGPPLLFLLVRSGSSPDLSPRHLVYALPLWAAIVGVGACRLLARVGPAVAATALGLLTVVLALAPAGVPDPRSLTYVAPLSSEKQLAWPGSALRAEVCAGDVLFPFSPVYLAGLPETGRAYTLPRAEPQLLADAVARVDLPAPEVFVAVPVGSSGVQLERLRHRGLVPERFGSWLIVRRLGPFRDRSAILDATSQGLRESRASRIGLLPPELAGYYAQGLAVIAGARARLDSRRG
jgi:hypothetical protein